MAKEFFRLLRMLPSGAFEYLVSYEGGSFIWSDNPEDAMPFESWLEWVGVAHSYWLTSGPMDLIYDRVYAVAPKVLSNA